MRRLRNKKAAFSLTVGTAAGGAKINGQLLEGYGHLEWGHYALRRHSEDSMKASVCSYHDCSLEG